MFLAWLLAVGLAAAPPPTGSAPPRKALRVAVYEVETTGVEPRVAGIVTDALLAELRKLQGVSVVGMDEIRAMLDHEAKRQLAGCEANEACLAEVAGALGADVVVLGSIARVGEENVFGLRRVDQRTTQVVGQVTQRLVPAGGEEFLGAVAPAVEELFPDLLLQPGRTRGVAPELALRVRPPPLPPWVFWSTASVGGMLAVAAASAGVVNVVERAAFEQLLAPADGVADGNALVKSRASVATSAWLFWGCVGGGAVVLGTAGVEALFVDWWGYGDDT